MLGIKKWNLKKWQLMGITLVLCVLASLVIEYTQFEDLDILCHVQKNEMVDLESYENSGYEVDGNTYVSVTEDPNLSGSVNTYIGTVTVRFAEALDTDLDVKVYYTTRDMGWCEENSQTVTAQAGSTEADIVVRNNALLLRLDIGDQAGQTFTLDSVVLNDPEVLTDEEIHFVWNSAVALMTRMLVVVLALWFVFANLILDRRKLYDNIYRYRFAIGALIVAYCTLFELSGSSIGCFSAYLGTTNELIFGRSRFIRSDEFALNTMMAFSQCNTQDAFSYFSDAFRGYSTDMFMVYGQPVWCLGEIFRPFQWGYLLFGASRGLAFFWSARTVALALVSFEFGMLITKKNKNLSVIYGMLMAFAPLVQWWFAVNGLVEMLVWAQLAVIMLERYIKAQSYRTKAVCALVIAECAGGYLLTLYPSWQIPIAYLLLGFIVWVFWENFHEIHVRKMDVLLIAGVFLVWAGILATVFYNSWETIQAVLGTEYPGSRSVLGGSLDNLGMLFVYPANLFYAFTEANIPLNTCEMAVMYDFFPLGLLLAIYVLCKNKKKDKLLLVTLVINVILALWCFLPWPELLAKITLLSMSQTARSILALEIGNVILLIRSLSLLERPALSKVKAQIVSAVLTGIVVVIANANMDEYLTTVMLVICVLVVFVSGYLILQYERLKYVFTVLCFGIVMVSGMYVNPVQQGIDVVTQSDLAKTVKAVDDEESGIWLADIPLGSRNIPSAMGLSVVNSTNVYPNMELWSKLDQDGTYTEIYNRYAWINVKFQSKGESSFELVSADYFSVNLNVRDLSKLGIDYIITEQDMTEYDCDEVSFELVAETGKNKIYKVDE